MAAHDRRMRVSLRPLLGRLATEATAPASRSTDQSSDSSTQIGPSVALKTLVGGLRVIDPWSIQERLKYRLSFYTVYDPRNPTVFPSHVALEFVIPTQVGTENRQIDVDHQSGVVIHGQGHVARRHDVRADSGH